MEKSLMKIKRLTVKNLYEHVGYDIKFNNNVTFLYGDNGCGKTTILNIITHIITGKIYKLFDYNFEEIVLIYQPSDSREYKRIELSRIDDNKIDIKFSSETDCINRRTAYNSRTLDEREDINSIYFSEHPILVKIKNTFNYIYLPLNRNSSLSLNSLHMHGRTTQMRYNYSKSKFYDSKFDSSMYEVESLVASAFNKSTTTLNRINENFCDDILKSFLDVEDIINTNKALQYIMSLNSTSIKKMQHDYIKVLKTLNKWDHASNKKVNAFFDSLQNDISARKKNDNQVNIEFLFKLSEISRITNIIGKAEKTEEEKKEARRPIETFLDTVNKFISNGSDNKEICIDEDGIIHLKTSFNNAIDIKDMSSGEKQIVTFFSYLIFGLENTNQSIFIVDEPELSLHLNWQRQFVDSIMNINKNVQLIFATHAPEIIGHHRNMAVKLIPEL